MKIDKPLRSIALGALLSVTACSTVRTTPIVTQQIAQGLWIANGSNVLEFLPTQLTAGVIDPTPHLVLNTTSGFGAPQGVQFDAAGDLYVLDGGSGSVAPAIDVFTASVLRAHGTPATLSPSKVITYPGITFPQQGVFDANGDFWVADNGANEVVAFTPSQLSAGGSQTPNLTLTSTIPFAGPLGIAFSPTTGTLWVANNGGTSIEGFSSSSLAGLRGTQTLTPASVVNDDGGGTVQGPWALVFDTSGNLWSSNANSPFTVVEFAANSLSGGTNSEPVPTVTISSATVSGMATLDAPNGLAFDGRGDLSAVSSASPFGVPVYLPDQLFTGSTTPNIFLVGPTTTLNAPAGDVFGPAVQ